MKCKKCGSKIKSQQNFCVVCGTKVEQFCSECGCTVEDGEQFCSSCGKPLTRVNEFKSSITLKKVEEMMNNNQSDITEEKNDEEEVKNNKVQESLNKNHKVERTLQMFQDELKELMEHDHSTKSIVMLFGRKVFDKYVYPYLENDEKMVAVRNIQSNMLLARGRKEFLILTDKRVIKFEKLQYLNPKIESCLLTRIHTIDAEKESNSIAGVLVGEKLNIVSQDRTIKLRTVGKGGATQIKEQILKIKGDSVEDNICTQENTAMEQPDQVHLDQELDQNKNKEKTFKEEFKEKYWFEMTNDEYRNKLVRNSRIYTLLHYAMEAICLIGAIRFKSYYGWFGVILVYFISVGIMSALLYLVGNNKYFGPKRVDLYDTLTSNSDRATAVTTLETSKGGTIRKVLIGFILLSTFGINAEVYNQVAIASYNRRIEKASSGEESVFEKIDSAFRRDVPDLGEQQNSYQVNSNTSYKPQETKPKKEQKQVQEYYNFQVGETVSTDNFDFTVTSAYIVDSVDGSQRLPEDPVYVYIEYDYMNISKQPISSWDLPTVQLADVNDALYDQDVNASWYYSNNDSKVISDMNPNIKSKGSKIFEVAVDILNAGDMRVYVQADKNFLVDLNFAYYDPYGYTPYDDEYYEGDGDYGNNVYEDNYYGNVQADDYH